MRLLFCIVVGIMTIHFLGKAQPGMVGEPCEPCSAAVSTPQTYDYTDNASGCSFRIEYDRFTNECNGHWDIKIKNVKLLTACSTYSVERIVALGILLLLQNNVPGFPLTLNGTTKIRVMSPACWKFDNIPTGEWNNKIIPCVDNNNCCQYYLLKNVPECNGLTVVHLPTNNSPVDCSLYLDCKYMCDDAWKIFFGK